MGKKVIKLRESQLRRMISEAISEIADSAGYNEVLNYLGDIQGTEDGERLLNALYGESAAGQEMARQELRTIFPSIKHPSFEAAICNFGRRFMNTNTDDEIYDDPYGYGRVAESKHTSRSKKK